MEQYISKSTLIGEIENKINKIDLNSIQDWRCRIQREHDIEVMKNILSLINTLEVKEVDLEKALSDLDKDIKEFVTTEEFENESTTAGHYWVIAKHAFLLGLKAQKGEL